MRLRAGLSCGVATCALLAGISGALADDFTVHANETVNVTQVLNGQGNVGLIEAGGTISTMLAFGCRTSIRASPTMG